MIGSPGTRKCKTNIFVAWEGELWKAHRGFLTSKSLWKWAAGPGAKESVQFFSLFSSWGLGGPGGRGFKFEGAIVTTVILAPGLRAAVLVTTSPVPPVPVVPAVPIACSKNETQILLLYT